jgi:hypothetical protein
VADRLDALDNLRASEELIQLLRKSENKLLPFGQWKTALVTNCRRLDTVGAARVAEAVVVAVQDPKTAIGVRATFASVLAAVGDQLDPVRADSLEGALVDSLLTDLADVKSLNLGTVGPMVTAVCGRAGAKCTARVGDALTETICNPQTPFEWLPQLVTVLGVAVARLPPGEASSRANRAIAVLESLSPTRTKPQERIVLAGALEAAWSGVGPTEASAYASKMVADLEDLLRSPKLTPFEQSRLARALGGVFRHLGPAEWAGHANTLLVPHANTLLAALRKPENNLDLATVAQFVESLVELCTLLDRPEAVRVFEHLLFTLSDLDIYGVRLDLSGFLYDSVEGRLKKVFSRLEEADLRRLLEHPLAVGRLQRVILDAVGEPRHSSFRNTWDYLDRTTTSSTELRS